VLDIMTATSAKPHAMTRFAQVEGSQITYPPEPETADAQPTLPGLEA
jgi:hypothetical protein